MPDNNRGKQKIVWSPRSSEPKKPSTKPTFDRPREFDFSNVAWEFKDFWSQKEPMEEVHYSFKQKKQ